MPDLVSQIMGMVEDDDGSKGPDLTSAALLVMMLEKLMARPRGDDELAVRPRIEPLGTF